MIYITFDIAICENNEAKTATALVGLDYHGEKRPPVSLNWEFCFLNVLLIRYFRSFQNGRNSF